MGSIYHLVALRLRARIFLEYLFTPFLPSDRICPTTTGNFPIMKLFSEHEVDIRIMRGGRHIRIVGTRPTIMLSVDDVFKGWYEDTDRAWKALDQASRKKWRRH